MTYQNKITELTQKFNSQNRYVIDLTTKAINENRTLTAEESQILSKASTKSMEVMKSIDKILRQMQDKNLNYTDEYETD